MSTLGNCHPERPLGARAHGAPFHAPLVTAIGKIRLGGAWNGDVRASRPEGSAPLLSIMYENVGATRLLVEDFYYAAINSQTNPANNKMVCHFRFRVAESRGICFSLIPILFT